jgi:hypothetical protein
MSMQATNIPFTSTSLNQIKEALKQQQPLVVHKDQNGLTIKPLGRFARIWYWRNATFHNKQLAQLADIFANALELQPRRCVHCAERDPMILAGRSLKKNIRRHNIHEPAIKKFQKQLLAAKLAIPAEVFEKNPGFQEFAERTHLERYLLQYHHRLEVDPVTHELSIRAKGQLTPWAKVFNEIQQWPKSQAKPQQPWLYGVDGVQNEDMYQWTELKPYKREDPAKWHYQYIFEFCACRNPATIKNGNHSWMRLKTPSGDVYSIGLYRPEKANWTDNLNLPLRVKPGFLMQPDVSEFWPYEVFSIPVAIAEKDFLAMKRALEEDKKNDDMVFQLFNNNCTLYCKKIASIGGIDLPTLERVIEVITPPYLQDRVNGFLSCFPAWVRKVCDVVQAFFINMGQICFGASLRDAHLNPKQRMRAALHIRSFWDIFNPEKSKLNHPITLIKLYHRINAWREEKIGKLLATEKNREVLLDKAANVYFGLPKKF